MIRKLSYVFGIRRDERLTAVVAAFVFTVFNALNVYAYWRQFSIVGGDYRSRFLDNYMVSGFDPLTYRVVSDWFPDYNVFRHPLLAFFVYPLYLVNKALMWLTGTNFAAIVTAALLVFCAVYSIVFLRRAMLNIVNGGGDFVRPLPLVRLHSAVRVRP